MPRFALLAALVAALAAPAAAQQPPTYSLTLVTDTNGGGNANVVTDEGIVGGSIVLLDTPGLLDPSEGYLWQGGQVYWQGSLGLDAAGVADINASGDAAGVAASATDGFNGEFRAFARLAGGEPVALPALPLSPGFDRVSYSYKLNDAGIVVGNARTDDPAYGPDLYNAYHAVVWAPSGDGTYAVTDLGTLGGGYSRAVGINNAGVVVGAAIPAEGDDIIRAVRWRPTGSGALGEIEDLGLVAPGDNFSEAKEVNAVGQVMGEAFGPGNGLAPAVWEPDGTGRRYPVLAGVVDCTANGFNDLATVVGQCSDLSSPSRIQATVWLDETLYFLRDLVDSSADGWTFQYASDVNNLGWIVGAGQRAGFVDSEGRPENFGFLLKPVGGSVNLTVTPLDRTVPASGGTVRYRVRVENTTAEARTFDYWAEVSRPQGAVVGRLGPVRATVGAGASVERAVSFRVPARAPAGRYVYTGFSGTFPGDFFDVGTFALTKSPSLTAPSDRDAPPSEPFEFDVPAFEEPVAASPAGDATITAFPNPFQQATTLRFRLAEAAEVRLTVYDVLGREVAVLAEGRAEGGEHTAQFDGRGLAPGVYVWRLERDGAVTSGRLSLVE